MMTGVVVGLLLGLCLALALALYLMKSSPFVARDASVSNAKKESRPDQNKPIPGLPAATPKPPGPQQAEPKPGEPRFGFYEMLPKPAESAPEHRPSAPVPPHEVYYLQAGAFQKSSDADNLKARLALIGLEAQIVTATVGESVWHRVRLGPFESERAMSEARGVLRDNRIEATVIKSVEPARD
jgi:cell division protein FtsN